MKIIRVDLRKKGYQIQIENGLIRGSGDILRTLDLGPRVVVISTRRILRLHGCKLVRSLNQANLEHDSILIPDGERHKTLSTLEFVYQKLSRLRATRKTSLIALGGGVVGDIVGFAAASYLRGLPYVQVPSTLLAQIDSSIGGKTGVNLSAGKNLVGAFCQPKAVLIDPELLATLPKREFDSGLYEALKYGVIRDRRLYNLVVQQHKHFLNKNKVSLEKMIIRCAQIKAAIVSKDEREDHSRVVLNFGHTLGHAIEAATHYQQFTHGQAIGHGMILATQISNCLGKIQATEAATIQQDVARLSPLPSLGKLRWKSIHHHMRSDKKIIDHRLKFVLPCRIGAVEIVQDTPPQLVENIVRAYLKSSS